MKIFFCETFDDGTVGGSHACMYNLIRHLHRPNMNCTVGFLGENIYVQKYRDLGIPVCILPIRNPLIIGNIMMRKAINWYRLEYKAGKYIENYFRREGFDLVVLNNSIFVSLLFVSVCMKLHIPVICYERGFAAYTKKHVKVSADLDCSIPVSDAVCNHMMSYGFRAKRIEMIYDGIDPSAYLIKNTPASIKAGLNIPYTSRVMGIIGNIRPWKGQKYFIDAFLELSSEYEDLYGIVAGGWSKEDERFVDILKKTVQEAGMGHRVMFLGYRRDVPDLLSIFDVFVHASTKPEPFGMVILEAMAARKPVVATNLGGPIEILNNGECGILVPPKDGKAIAAACRRYLNDSRFCRTTIERAYGRLMTNFQIDHTVERTVRIIESFSDKSNPRSEMQELSHHDFLKV